ncbi:MAG: hypothetical protein ACYDA2_00800 [Acidimicrobiales bacterium]
MSVIVDVLTGGTLLSGRVVFSGMAALAGALLPPGEAFVRVWAASAVLAPHSLRPLVAVVAGGIGLGASIGAVVFVFRRGATRQARTSTGGAP